MTIQDVTPKPMRDFEITCDRCWRKHRYKAGLACMLPAGWRVVSVGPCGSTGYYRDGHECPECHAERLERERDARLAAMTPAELGAAMAEAHESVKAAVAAFTADLARWWRGAKVDARPLEITKGQTT